MGEESSLLPLDFDLKYIISLMPGNVYWMDRRGEFRGCNNNMLEMLGLKSEAEYIGKSYDDLYEKSHIDVIRKTDERIMRCGFPETIEEVALDQKGNKAIYLTRKSPLLNQSGEVIGLLGVSIDITERKKLEGELRESRFREEHFKAMSSIGGMIAHELRTPLMSIELNAQTLSDYMPNLMDSYEKSLNKVKNATVDLIPVDRLREIPSHIDKEARYCSNTITMILKGFHHISSDSFLLEKVELSGLVKDAISDYPMLSEERSLIQCSLEGEFWGLVVPDIVIHVLNNLLKNALYAIKTAARGDISISMVKAEDAYIALQFKDTATGISENIIEHIFEPFYTTKDHETSIGLGLYFCKLALEKMQGSIDCESKEGVFTSFLIKFKAIPG